MPAQLRTDLERTAEHLRAHGRRLEELGFATQSRMVEQAALICTMVRDSMADQPELTARQQQRRRVHA